MTPTAIHNVTFHGVGEPPRPLDSFEAAVWLSEERFLSTLDALRDRDNVRISFDDGNRSDVELALPALAERGMTATFFVLAGRLEDPQHLGVEDLELLLEAGMAVESHGLNHQDWRLCSDDDLVFELAESRRILQNALCRPVTQVAVPFGSYDRRVLGFARRSGGYERIFTSDGGPAHANSWLQPRTSVASDGATPAGLAARPVTVAAAQRSAKRLVKRWR